MHNKAEMHETCINITSYTDEKHNLHVVRSLVEGINMGEIIW